MARPREYRYTVEGAGRFPLDMLRYDAAWPACGTDVNEITDSFEPRTLGDPSRRVEVASKHKPTTARWESFDWRVLEVRPYY